MASQERSLREGEFVTRVQAAQPRLGDADRQVIDAILKDPAEAVRSAVGDIAARAGTATSSVVRTCQRLGFRGFQDVKLSLARDIALQGPKLAHDEGIDGDTPDTDVLRHILIRSGRALTDAVQTVDPEAFHAAVDRLAAASRILVIGNGTSASPAHDAAYRFIALGITATAPADAIAQHLMARQLDDSCACLIISHTGATRETLQAAEEASRRGATVIAITSFLGSSLARLAEVSLVAGGPEYGFRLEAMASRLAHLAVVDALFVAVAFRRAESSASALDAMAEITAMHSL